MASTDNGGQIVTFDYKQEGTSRTFNKLNHNLFSSGFVSMGNNGDYVLNGTTVSIPPFRAVLKDESAGVTVNLYTQTDATVDISASTPYIIGVWNWQDMEENYLGIQSVGFSDLQSADLIFGKWMFDGGIPRGPDYSRRTWSQLHYDKIENGNPDFLTYIPDPIEDPTELKVMVGTGSAIVDGSSVEFLNPKLSPEVDWLASITNKMKVLVTVDKNGDIDFVKGNDVVFPTVPPFPSDKLVVAVLTLESGQTKVFEGNKGNIEYIYNNNFVQGESVNRKEFDDLVNSQGQADGIATLDNTGRLPENQLTSFVMKNRGDWSAFTNIPNLFPSQMVIPPENGDWYNVTTDRANIDINEDGTPLYFKKGDVIMFNGVYGSGGKWIRLSHGTVFKINNISPNAEGNVTLPIDNYPTASSNNPAKSDGLTSKYIIENVPTISGGGTYDLLRCGNVVTLNIRGLEYDASVGNINPVNIPSFYIPKSSIRVCGSYGSGSLDVDNLVLFEILTSGAVVSYTYKPFVKVGNGYCNLHVSWTI